MRDGAGHGPHLLAYPMHGTRKLLREGYRTRDGHMIEWASRLLPGPVAVVSRPEPFWLPMRTTTTERQRQVANSFAVDARSARVPRPWNRRRWWQSSVTAFPAIPERLDGVPAIVWNPFAATIRDPAANPFTSRRVVLDLLDDWTVHFAFRGIADAVDRAYRAAFDAADAVTVNAEGTLALAHRYGRDDAELILNGVDPERFAKPADAAGPITVGYVGKIGRRVDLEAVLGTARALPDVRFVFAGPVLDAEYRAPLAATSNIELLGDVHYDRVPELLRSFDIGWVPHRVGDGEVGGDVIKTYEYRAAGLPVVTTPIAGAASRGLGSVHVAAASELAICITSLIGGSERVERVPESIPVEHTWQTKVQRVLSLAGIDASSTSSRSVGP